MTVLWRSSVVLLTVVFLSTWFQVEVKAEDETSDSGSDQSKTSNHENSGKSGNHFIDFTQQDNTTDSFIINQTQYLIVDMNLKYSQAKLMCREKYQARLSALPTLELSNFMAEALSETRLTLDTLWTAGTKQDNSKDDWVWETTKQDDSGEISTEIKHLMATASDITVSNRNCLGFGRMNHSKPQFRPLNCDVTRSFICDRPKSGSGGGNSTHPGWIKIDNYLYKIFNIPVDHETASVKCLDASPDASLAMIPSYDIGQKLGRYLLIGRPSLENAWIGGKWVKNQYKFLDDNILISNYTNLTSKYPPWRNNSMQTTNGCLLLDRHLSNITLFVEARCSRQRSYICYKSVTNGTENATFTDVIIDPYGYRLIYNPMDWFSARNFCANHYANYSSKLVEIDDAVQSTNLLYVMGENKTAVQHIWIGGRMNGSTWLWDSTDTEINVNDSSSGINWIHNNTFTESVEEVNTCMNMDRENHRVPIHYGATCKFHQSFVCSFTAENLKKLQDDEKSASNRK